MAGPKNIKKGWGELGGGSGKMHKFAPTGAQKPGGSSQEGHSGSRRDIKVQPGGTVGFYSTSGNKSYAGTQTAGQSAAQPTGGNDKFAKGGSNHMFGNRGSQRRDAGKSGQ
jgi:hypothetical protein